MIRDDVRAELWFDDTGTLRRSRELVVDASIPHALLAPNGTVLEDTTLEAATLVPSTSATGG